MRLLAEVVRHTHDGYHMLLSACHHHRLPLHHRGIDGYAVHLPQFLQPGIISLYSSAFGKGDAQLGIEGRKEAGNQIMKAVKYA